MTDDKEAIVNGHCPKCGPNRRADVVGEHEVRWEDDETGVWGHFTYRILRCRGCYDVYFQRIEVFSEDIDYRQNPRTGEPQMRLSEKINYWPAPSKRDQPTWSSKLDGKDRDLASLFDDIYVALNNDLRILAAVGVRTAFDRASELLGIDPAKTFQEKLGDLASENRISSDEKDAIEVLTDAGSAAAHRGWKPKLSELNNMMSILESFLHRSFIIGDDAKSLKESVPPRHQRKKSSGEFGDSSSP